LGANVTLENLVLLPGLDGTGKLFADFIRALPQNLRAVVVAYPTDQFLSYPELLDLVRGACLHAERFVLLAESFSTPLAVRYAAENPPGLCGLIICAGFLTNPLPQLPFLKRAVSDPWLVKIQPPDFLLKRFLLGRDASPALLEEFRLAIDSVKPWVLARRLGEISRCNVETELGRTKVPLIYLRAVDDKLVPNSCGDRFVQIRPDVVLESVAAPHLLLQRRPREAAVFVSRFIERL
jgi:pimeloyl-[acyl-carrier protein] methyl ester esterase